MLFRSVLNEKEMRSGSLAEVKIPDELRRRIGLHLPLIVTCGKCNKRAFRKHLAAYYPKG